MTTIDIDPAVCKHDGACAQICPIRIFQQRPDEPPAIRRVEHCVLCGQCLAVCPNSAINHSRLEATRLAKIDDRRPVAPAAMMAAIRQRRSVRLYKKKPVATELLEEIAAVVAYAPTSAHGGDGWVRSVTVVTGEDKMQKVYELTGEYLRRLVGLMSSNVARVISLWSTKLQGGLKMLPDMQFRLAEYDQGRDALIYQAPAALFVHTPRDTPVPTADCDSAMMAIMLAAEAHGLGTCWNGYLAKAATGFKVKFPDLRNLLAIPESHDVYAAATIGYSKLKLHSVPQRDSRVRVID